MAPDLSSGVKLLQDDDITRDVRASIVWLVCRSWRPGRDGEPREPTLVLVLTRKTSQSIMIGDDIEVTVLSNDGGKVRLGIQAPTAVPVHRTEIYRKIQAERQGVPPTAQARAQGSRA